MIEKAKSMKDEGNFFFKQKDYKKAISKYCRVQLYIKPVAPLESSSAGDPTLSMVSGMKQFKIDAELTKECHELQAVAYLNMAICWYLLKNYEKSKENAK